jgi:hypothetical protein
MGASEIVGMKIVEYYIRSILEDGIADLRKNIDLLNDVFSHLLTDPLLNVKFGYKILDDIKKFFRENDIPVRSAWSQNQFDLPCITVHLLSSQEDPQYRAFQDHVGYMTVPKVPSVILGPFYGTSYDPITGKIIVSKDLDMTNVNGGTILYCKRSNEYFTVRPTIVWNEPGTLAHDKIPQYFHIVDEDGTIPESVDFAELYILSSVDFETKRIAAITLMEIFEIRVNASTSSDEAIWLYYVVLYILSKNKNYFESVGLESQTFSANDFSRDAPKAPNNVWGRTFRMTFRVQHSWVEEEGAIGDVSTVMEVDHN